MAIEVITVFPDKATVRVIAFVYDETGALTDPTGSIKCTIYDPDGTKQADAQAMTKITDVDSPAKDAYEYYYHKGTGLDPMDKGEWRGEIEVIDGAGDDAITSMGKFTFSVR